MKRRVLGDREKEVKKEKLLQQIGGAHLPFVSPKDEKYNQLWKTRYAKLVTHEAQQTPAELHDQVQKAFLTLLHHGCLFQDLVQLKGKDVFTPVSRILIGEPGCTYKYLNTRLFALPWPDDKSETMYNTEEIADACKAFYKLNTFMYEQTKLKLHTCEINTPFADVLPEQVSSESNVPPYNVTLINYMSPQDMPYLKDEPYFGMGKMAVSWHHDENLLEGSTVAVYNYSLQVRATEEVESKWHVGLKIAWDIDTPGLALPLNSGDSYFMLGDLNTTHQHCVIAGSQPRFSSTHRVAECSMGTLNYIQSRCKTALKNLNTIPHGNKKTLNSLDAAILTETEEIHNQVEFEWLCQYWFQGMRYTKCSDFWIKPLADLEENWMQMEIMTSLMLEDLNKDTWEQEERCKILKSVFPLLEERQQLRQEWRHRCNSKLAKSLPVEQRPQCYSHWEEDDPSFPLPFDLTDILTDLEHLMQTDQSVN